MSTVEMINELNNREVFFRIENNDDYWYLSHVDRRMFPRLWMDNALDSPVRMLAESVENILQRNSPLPEKDWHRRFENEDFDKLIKEFYDYINNPRPQPVVGERI